jgi:NAD(P)-dependent dehydrogenase (short-subunit alcohol dehydrogenase family)
LTGDVSDEQFWAGSEQELAGLTHAVINAGVSSSGMIDELDFAEWRRVMSVNLDGAFLTLRSAMRAIRQSSGPRSIVITASVTGMKAEPGVAAYGASKAALIQLMRVAAKEAAPDGIRVNAIAPGGVDTPIWDEMPFFEQLVEAEGSRDAAIDALAKMATPLGGYATAEEIAAQIDFLLSGAAATITGAVLTSDGGYSL